MGRCEAALSLCRVRGTEALRHRCLKLATLFYTSGTTGMPKGVEGYHGGHVNLGLTYAGYFDVAPGINATPLLSSLGYDGSISEM
jgi:hypothetical protein